MQILYLTPGDDFVYTAPILDTAGVAYSLTGATLWFTVKRRLDNDPTDADAIAKLYWVSGGASSGITVATPSTGVAVIRLTPTQTDDFVQAAYHWDLQLQDTGGVRRTVDSGRIVVLRTATMRVTTP
jgi:hypothetical protein